LLIGKSFSGTAGDYASDKFSESGAAGDCASAISGKNAKRRINAISNFCILLRAITH
jgi:hypothetical protein